MKNQTTQTTEMTTTYQELVAQYKIEFASETVAKIDELLADSFALEDILEFIENKNETLFVKYYEDYCTVGENLTYHIADAFVDEFGLENISYCEEAYEGCYLVCHNAGEQFAEYFFTEVMCVSIPEGVIVDWEATWNSTLQYDYVWADGYIFNKNF